MLHRSFLYAYALAVSMNVLSCTLMNVMDNAHTFSNRNKEDYIPGYVRIYVENNTNELLVVTLVLYDTNGEKTGTMELARVSQDETTMLNIEKGRIISVIGGNTRQEYLKASCENDYESFEIW